MTRKRTAARRLGKEWGPDAAFVVVASLFLLAPQGYVVTSIALVVGAVGWVLGHRHRRLPMQATLDGVRQDVSEVREIIVSAVAAAEPPQADAEPVRNFRVVR